MDEGEPLVRRARDRQARAYEVLEALRLLQAWRKVGEPVLVGAARTGLIVTRDIDLEIYTSAPRIADGFALMSELAEHRGVTKIRFANELAGPDQGLYWQVRYVEPNGDDWKIDNWLMAHDHPQAHWAERFADALVAALSDETRTAILRIKEALQGQGDARGIDIYRAVLEGRARSATQFRQWQAETQPESLVWWMPADAARVAGP